jgi:hypothetical protein
MKAAGEGAINTRTGLNTRPLIGRDRMSENHSSNGRLIPAAAYYRMSDPRQDASVERQRSQVVPYAAKHGYEIVREYTDDGIPDDEIERRGADGKVAGR